MDKSTLSKKYIIDFLLSKNVPMEDIVSCFIPLRAFHFSFDWGKLLKKHPHVFYSNSCPMFKDGKCTQRGFDYCIKEIRKYNEGLKIGFIKVSVDDLCD